MSEHPDIKYLKSDNIAPVLMKGNRCGCCFTDHLLTGLNFSLRIVKTKNITQFNKCKQ